MTTSEVNDVRGLCLHFVKQFYTVMNMKPDDLFKFYNENSVLSRSESEEAIGKTVYGDSNINQFLLELGLKGSKVNVVGLECQPSLAGSVLVVVSGEITFRELDPRKFTQTFLLAPQENGYYVHNDVFRFTEAENDFLEAEEEPREAVEDSRQHPPTEAKEAEEEKKLDSHSVVPDVQIEVIHQTKESTILGPLSSASSSVVPKFEDPPQSKVSFQEEPTAKPVKTNRLASQNSDQDSSFAFIKPKSWASIAKSVEISSSIPSPTSKPPAGPLALDSSLPSLKSHGSSQGKDANLVSSSGSFSAETQRGHSCTIFVKGIFPSCTAEILASLFESFGKILDITILHSKGIAYVDFDHATAVEKILSLKGDHFKYGDHVLVPEQRKQSSRTFPKPASHSSRLQPPVGFRKRLPSSSFSSSFAASASLDSRQAQTVGRANFKANK